VRVLINVINPLQPPHSKRCSTFKRFNVYGLVGWSLTSIFSTNTAVSETIRLGDHFTTNSVHRDSLSVSSARLKPVASAAASDAVEEFDIDNEVRCVGAGDLRRFEPVKVKPN